MCRCCHCLFIGRGFGVGSSNPFVASLVKFICQFGASRFDDSTAEHHMRAVGNVVFEELFVVGDD